jgi:hypothetical protein
MQSVCLPGRRGFTMADPSCGKPSEGKLLTVSQHLPRILMNVQKRCLDECKRQHQVHQDGDTELHTDIVAFGDWSYLKLLQRCSKT